MLLVVAFKATGKRIGSEMRMKIDSCGHLTSFKHSLVFE